jgi:hypothetical protein
MVAAVCAVVAYQRAVAEQQQVRIRVEEGAARVAAEAVDMPSVSGEFKGLAFLEDLSASLARIYNLVLDRRLWVGPGTLHGGLEICVGEGTMVAGSASAAAWSLPVLCRNRRDNWQTRRVVDVVVPQVVWAIPKVRSTVQGERRSIVETAQKQSQQPEGASVHWRTASVRDEG